MEKEPSPPTFGPKDANIILNTNIIKFVENKLVWGKSSSSNLTSTKVYNLLMKDHGLSLEHVFFSLSYAISIWYGIDLTLKTDHLQESTVSNWLEDWFCQWKNHANYLDNTILLIMTTMDNIFAYHNEALHRNLMEPIRLNEF